MKPNQKLNDLLSEVVHSEKTDSILKSWVNTLADEELRNEMASTLQADFKIDKGSSKKSKTVRLRTWITAAASIAILISVFFYKQNMADPDVLAAQYLQTQFVEHPGNSKGFAQVNSFRSEAILAFNEEAFLKAAENFEKITEPTQEDIYYLGLSFLKTGQYSKASESLEKCLSEGSRFKEEATWFLAISLILEGKEANSKVLLEEIKKVDWQYEKAQKLIKTLSAK